MAQIIYSIRAWWKFFFISRGPKSALTDCAFVKKKEKKKKTTYPGRTRIDYLSKFLSAASSRPGCSDASTALSALKNQYSMKEALILPQLAEKKIKQNWKKKEKKKEVTSQIGNQNNLLYRRNPDWAEPINRALWSDWESRIWMQFPRFL